MTAWAAALWAASVAAGAPSYAGAMADARVVTNLGRFLESYLGDCVHEKDDPDFDKAACEADAQTFRERNSGKLQRIEVESPGEELHFAGWDAHKKAFRLHLTPFFAERGLALTVGKPTLTAGGAPTVKNVPIWVRLPEGEEELTFRRQLERGMVRLELLVEPGKPWSLKPKDGKGLFRGVDVTLIGLRLYGNRASQVLAEQTYP